MMPNPCGPLSTIFEGGEPTGPEIRPFDGESGVRL